LAGIKNFQKSGVRKIFLTKLGGGAFGNRSDWITSAIKTAILKYKNVPLHVHIVSYGHSDPDISQLLDEISKTT